MRHKQIVSDHESRVLTRRITIYSLCLDCILAGIKRLLLSSYVTFILQCLYRMLDTLFLFECYTPSKIRVNSTTWLLLEGLNNVQICDLI